jgi:hypothetical protein
VNISKRPLKPTATPSAPPPIPPSLAVVCDGRCLTMWPEALRHGSL